MSYVTNTFKRSPDSFELEMSGSKRHKQDQPINLYCDETLPAGYFFPHYTLVGQRRSPEPLESPEPLMSLKSRPVQLLSLKDLNDIDQKIVKWVKSGASFLRLDNYFSQEYGQAQGFAKERWMKYHEDNYRELDGSFDEPLDAFIFGGLREKLNFFDIAMKYNADYKNKILIEQHDLKNRFNILKKFYPDVSYYPNPLPDDDARDQMIVHGLKYGLSFHMIGKKLDLHHRDVKNHWYYRLAFKYKEVKPLCTKIYEEECLKDHILYNFPNGLEENYPFLQKDDLHFIGMEIWGKYRSIIEDLRTCYHAEIQDMRSGKISLYDLMESYATDNLDLEVEPAEAFRDTSREDV